MFSRPMKSLPTALRHCAPLAVGILLAACSADWTDPTTDDVFVPADPQARFPIEVTKGTARLAIPTRSARMTPSMEAAVVRFGQEAASSGAKQVYIRRPTGGMSSDVVAGRVTQLLAEQGVSAKIMKHTSYRAGAGAPVEVSFTRKFAVSPECGDWSESLVDTPKNTVYPNFGCAQQHNLAATVANPQDFITPRTETAVDGKRREAVIEAYRKSGSAATSSDVTVSTK